MVLMVLSIGPKGPQKPEHEQQHEGAETQYVSSRAQHRCLASTVKSKRPCRFLLFGGQTSGTRCQTPQNSARAQLGSPGRQGRKRLLLKRVQALCHKRPIRRMSRACVGIAPQG